MHIRYAKFEDQNYKKILLHCARTGSNFEDTVFPRTDSSLFKRRRPVQGRIVWKRCKDLCSNPRLFLFEKQQLSPEVVQGGVGNCWLVSALGVLAAHPHLLHKVVPKWELQDWSHSDEPGRQLGVYNWRDTEKHPGIFRFRFYRFGRWIEVVIDDYLPTVNGRLIYAHSKNPNEMWCALLEKAYAKICGSYEALEAGTASDALVDLTGTVPENVDLLRGSGSVIDKMGDKNFVKYMVAAYRKGSLMSCAIAPSDDDRPEEKLPNGLIVGHAYGVTGVITLKLSWRGNKDVTLIRLHNPWGAVEWNGPWSDRSKEWERVNASQRKRLGMKVADDGDFWMAFDDFIFNFSTLVICRNLNTPWYRLGKRWHRQLFRGEWSIEGETAGGCINNVDTFYRNPQYVLTINKPTVAIIALMQEDRRNERLNGAENLTIGFICLKIEHNRKYRIHKSSYDVSERVTYINAREVTTRATFEPGRYVLIPSTYNPNEEGWYFLRLYSDRPLNVSMFKRDAPKRRWYYPILYWGKSYYVGMVRVQVMQANLKKDIRGYVKLTFTDLKDRKKKVCVTRTFPRSNKPNIGNEYVFYVRDPRTSGVFLELFEHKTFGSDTALGEVHAGLEAYSKEGKEGRMWEVTKTLSRTIKVEQPFSTLTTRENEAGSDSAHVEHQTAPPQTALAPGARRKKKRPKRKGRPGRSANPPKKLIPQRVDAGVGEIQFRISYFKGVLA